MTIPHRFLRYPALAIVFTCLSLACGLAAQESAEEEMLPIRKLSFIAINEASRGAFENLFVRAHRPGRMVDPRDPDEIPLQVNHHGRGPVVRVLGDPPFPVLRENPEEPTPENPNPPPFIQVGELDFDRDWFDVMFVVNMNRQGERENLISFPINMGVDRFPPGSFRLINVHRESVACKVDDEIFKLDYMDDRLVVIDREEGSRVPIVFKLMKEKNGHEDLMSTYTRFQPGRRILCLVRVTASEANPREIAPDLNLIIDHPPKP